MSEKGLSGLWYDKKKEWELVELPVYQPDDDEIVVRVTATGISGSDLHVTRGDGRDGRAASSYLDDVVKRKKEM